MTPSLPHALEKTAARFPQRTALRYDGQGLSYAALNQQAHKLARLLQACGVRRGDRVGLYLRKSFEAVVAIYGVMRAGAAYVPLDPFAPAARQTQIIKDCGIRHLITEPESTVRLHSFVLDTSLAYLVGTPSMPDVPIPCISWDDVLGIELAQELENPVNPDDLAYILYTSSSTGAPKGIAHTHASALSFAQWAADAYELSPADRVGNHAPYHLDLSTFDLFAAMLKGAATVIIPEYLTKFPIGLAQLLADESISVWHSAPYALIQLLEHGHLNMWNLAALRWVLFAGEPFPPPYLRRLMARWPQARFSHLYGPTETHVCAYYHIPSMPADADAAIPIGRACAGVQLMVADERGHPVAPGECGELWINSSGAMRGYWQRPELDARSFALGGHGGVRFYRTGDRVQQRLDGNLLYLGRQDRQVNIRGYRVELDEIEAVLLSHGDIQEAIVYTATDERGSRSLVGMIIPKAGSALTAQQVKQHVAQQLPSHARPSSIVIAPELPRAADRLCRRQQSETTHAVA